MDEESSSVLVNQYSLLIPGFLDISRYEPQDVKMRHVRVLVDGELLGQLAYGQSRRFAIRPGDHKLVVTNTLNHSQADFTVKSGEAVRFSCSQRASDMALVFFVFLGAGNMPVHLQRLS